MNQSLSRSQEIYHESSHVCPMELSRFKEMGPKMVGVGGASQDHTHQVCQRVAEINI